MGNLSAAEIRVVLRVRDNRRTTSATHFYQSVQYFRVSKQRYGCQYLGFLTCTQMLMPAIAHGGCTDNVRHWKLKVDSGEKKNNCCTRDSNPSQYCACLFSRTLYQLSYPRPCTQWHNLGRRGRWAGCLCVCVWGGGAGGRCHVPWPPCQLPPSWLHYSCMSRSILVFILSFFCFFFCCVFCPSPCCWLVWSLISLCSCVCVVSRFLTQFMIICWL